MKKRRIIISFFAILSVISGQDAPVNLLPTDPPRTTTTESIETTTTTSFYDETEETPSLPPPENQQKGNDDDDDDYKGAWIDSPSEDLNSKGDHLTDATHPLYIYPQISYPPYYPSYRPNCDSQPPIQIPIPVQPNYNTTSDDPEQEIIQRCPIGSWQNGTTCVQFHQNNCPPNFVWDDNVCRQSHVECPMNFEYDGTSCVERQVCPPNHIFENGRCTQPEPSCPLGFRWNGSRCVPLTIQCPPGSVWRNKVCVVESVTCPSGQTLINNECIKPPPVCQHGFEWNVETEFCEQINLKCPEGTKLINGQCYKTIATCPIGSEKIGDQCYQILTTTYRPPPVTITPYPPYTTTRRTTPRTTRTTRYTTRYPPNEIQTPNYPDYPTPNYPTPPSYPDPRPPIYPPNYPKICPDGFTFYNHQCYRCPDDYSLCNGMCLRKTRPCGDQTSGGYYPPPPNYYPGQHPQHPQLPPNINININHPKPDYNYRPPSSESRPVNIVNNIEPANNTIININNFTHPITLNNVNENNIHIYTETQCADGSIRATIVKNNETITGCVDGENSSFEVTTRRRKNEHEEDGNDGNDGNDHGEKCCEVVTPRQCKKRYTEQWICTHRRYKYCGKFCIAERLYMRPPTTTYNNQVLTFAPAPANKWLKPCYGRECPPVDCTGCTNGSYDCSPQCYTYPCYGNTCTYIDADDFCENVDGNFCD